MGNLICSWFGEQGHVSTALENTVNYNKPQTTTHVSDAQPPNIPLTYNKKHGSSGITRQLNEI